MWPTIFEFSWDTGHMIFFGVFYAVVIIIATSLVYAFAKSIVDTFSNNGSFDDRHAHKPMDKNETLGG
ncbi:MAG: hypothetical protein C4532_04935 [Candidatus Abyssobacteria bacterium SURF_17]|uniref:Uncharacterized protein n=1 Tax=Candidatus Abyssobacteria bacterium SURF_17 TaxID=2093361 RepID=A0A419F3T4_9BACT|nr:MAG: hypothetical protein C4532_04935 [Candidatus Abyssubacteria bacterium SURF_17]